MVLRIALVGGPMYDHIEAAFEPGEVEIIVKADHPTLNQTVAAMLADGVRIDVLATHSKYVPSQIDRLLPLDDPNGIMIDTSSLARAAVSLCQFEQTQWCVPRLIDVRLLWSRADRVATPPTTWSELGQLSHVFGFTGKESGAFGMFFELVTAAGGTIFDSDLQPTLDSEIAINALTFMQRLSQRVPRELPNWHYDDVSTALLNGQLDIAAAWPGGWSAIRSSALPLAPSLYPAGTHRAVSYSGCHAWAIPNTCGDVPSATALVQRLCSSEVHALDASAGSICAHMDALNSVSPVNEVDQLRLQLTQQTISTMMITYPPLRSFPAIEQAGATAITALLRGDLTPVEAATAMQRDAQPWVNRSSHP
jgi:multiple sugar transport system substrate-binding protein